MTGESQYHSMVDDNETLVNKYQTLVNKYQTLLNKYQAEEMNCLPSPLRFQSMQFSLLSV